MGIKLERSQVQIGQEAGTVGFCKLGYPSPLSSFSRLLGQTGFLCSQVQGSKNCHCQQFPDFQDPFGKEAARLKLGLS